MNNEKLNAVLQLAGLVLEDLQHYANRDGFHTIYVQLKDNVVVGAKCVETISNNPDPIKEDESETVWFPLDSFGKGTKYTQEKQAMDQRKEKLIEKLAPFVVNATILELLHSTLPCYFCGNSVEPSSKLIHANDKTRGRRICNSCFRDNNRRAILSISENISWWQRKLNKLYKDKQMYQNNLKTFEQSEDGVVPITSSLIPEEKLSIVLLLAKTDLDELTCASFSAGHHILKIRHVNDVILNAKIKLNDSSNKETMQQNGLAWFNLIRFGNGDLCEAMLEDRAERAIQYEKRKSALHKELCACLSGFTIDPEIYHNL